MRKIAIIIVAAVLLGLLGGCAGKPADPESPAIVVGFSQLGAESSWRMANTKSVEKAAKEYGSLNPPAHILNAPTKLMANLGYGRDYCYDHDTPEGFSGQNYFPDGMPRQRYYRPVERGFEREVAKRLAWYDKLRREKSGNQ